MFGKRIHRAFNLGVSYSGALDEVRRIATNQIMAVLVGTIPTVSFRRMKLVQGNAPPVLLGVNKESPDGRRKFKNKDPQAHSFIQQFAKVWYGGIP